MKCKVCGKEHPAAAQTGLCPDCWWRQEQKRQEQEKEGSRARRRDRSQERPKRR